MTTVSNSGYGSGLVSQLQQLLASQRQNGVFAARQNGDEAEGSRWLSGSCGSGASFEAGGSCSAGDLQSVFRQLGEATRNILLQAQSGGEGVGGRDQAFAERVAKLDTDGDGQISREEFVAGRPQNVSEDQAGGLFDQIDSEGTGSLSTDALASGLAELRPQHGQHGPPPGLAGGESESTTEGTDSKLAELVAKLDTDGDGQISREEFIAGRPERASEEQAGSLFDQIDSEGIGSLSTDALASGLAELRPHHGHHGPPPGPPPTQSEGDSDDATTSIASSDTTSQSGDAATTADSTTEKLLAALVAQFQRAAQSYGAQGGFGQSLFGLGLDRTA